jgi:hypothetical protein
LRPSFFSVGPQREILAFLQKNPDFKGDPKLAKQLQSNADYVKIISLQFEELYQDLPLEDLQMEAGRLKHRLIDRYVKIQKRELANKMQSTSDETQLNELMKAADKLNELIKR